MEWQEKLQPELAIRQIVHQATEALVRMDAERLEELARCCAVLNREIENAGDRKAARAQLGVELRKAEPEVKLLGRVLGKTRANLTVLMRLHVLRLEKQIDSQAAPAIGPVGYRSRKIDGFHSMEKAAEYGDN
ncbi:hypothetical protein [Acidicapsa acidisoli]|uniref:hypothetical protein n=1 Tax=Acidicapsa acidisoli TaxID=1615681 RepID=UPI0021E043AB|nr:hypothetical protein [Acidicapsa acidisoli]